MQEFVSIDFETANPKRVSACAFGYAKVANGQLIESNEYIIKPVGGHASFQSRIHGIKEEHTIDKPDFEEIFSEISLIFNFPLVAHSLFDKQVLNALADHFRLNLSFEYTDTCAIAKQQLPNLKNHRLKDLVKHLNLPKFKHHNAKEDAIACANIFLKLNSNDDMREFEELINDTMADDEVDYKEAYELLYWLEDHPKVRAQYPDLYERTKTALEDEELDDIEAQQIRSVLVDTMKS